MLGMFLKCEENIDDDNLHIGCEWRFRSYRKNTEKWGRRLEI